MAEELKKASTGLLILSFFIPIVGVILYFVKKKEVVDAVKYLYAAGAGFVLGVALRLITR